MSKEKYVITVDEEAQCLIINSLLLMRDTKIKEGLDVDWIGDVIIDICNAPRKRIHLRGDLSER